MVFSVKNKNDAKILLTNGTGIYDRELEITLGGWHNTKSYMGSES